MQKFIPFVVAAERTDGIDNQAWISSSHVPAVLKEHNMPPIRFHDLRHSCASLLFSQGVSLKEIQAWLGHSTIGTTANIYTHLDENNKLSSANAILSILPEK